VSLVELKLSLRRRDVLHALGYPEGYVPSPRVGALLDPLIAEARRLVRPIGAWRRLEIGEATVLGLEPLVARDLVIGLVTIGGALEAAASSRLAGGEATAALVLDACGSAAVEEAADRLGAAIVHAGTGIDDAPEPLADPAALGCRVSPGYGRWALAAQPALFARLPHAALGVRLEPSLLMVPRKSISFAMWLGADARPIAGLSGCARCALEGCRFRRTARRAS